MQNGNDIRVCKIFKIQRTRREKWLELLTSKLQILYLIVQSLPLHSLRLHRRCCREIPPPHVLKERNTSGLWNISEIYFLYCMTFEIFSNGPRPGMSFPGTLIQWSFHNRKACCNRQEFNYISAALRTDATRLVNSIYYFTLIPWAIFIRWKLRYHNKYKLVLSVLAVQNTFATKMEVSLVILKCSCQLSRSFIYINRTSA